MLRKIKRAIISVSDKNNLLQILTILKRFKIEIVSSGGTYDLIRKMGFSCQDISTYTGFDEMLDGRVKTLHPKIHAGILHNRKNSKHTKQMKLRNFNSIDLIIVNFYPFEKVLKSSSSLKKIIENIDIGGPSMVRGAAKNFNDVTTITDKNDYSRLIGELKRFKGKTSLNFRKEMASKAFGLTAYYDSIVSDWFNREIGL